MKDKNQTKTSLFEKSYNINKLNKTDQKKEKMQITNVRNKIGIMSTNPEDIKKIRKNFEQQTDHQSIDTDVK